MTEKSSLERKLEIIRELKADNYVGTAGAWNYLAAVDAIYTVPEKIVRKVNELLQQKKHQPRFTLEHVLGLSRALAGIETNAMVMEREILDQDELEKNILAHEEDSAESTQEPLKYLSSSNYFNRGKGRELDWNIVREPKEFDEKIILDIATPLAGLIAEAESNEEFLSSAVRTYCESYPFSPEQKALRMSSVSLVDVEELFSKKVSRVWEKTAIDLARETHLNTEQKIGRLTNDWLSHRVEYQREIIADFVNKFGTEIQEYTGFIKMFDDKIERRRVQLDKLTALKAPEQFLESERRMIHEAEYSKSIFEQNRSFVLKLLGKIK